ncbi:methylenetetrahydrofolate reductase [NAD(P)H] [Streptomyces sp. NPDC054794]
MTALATPPRSVAAALRSSRRSYSFEFFPPRTPQAEAVLWAALRQVERLGPSFVSITYGAGGTSRDGSIAIVRRIVEETTLTPLAHLTAVGQSTAELRRIIGEFADAGVRDILALRGDPPGDPLGPWRPHPQGLRHAADLVRLIRESSNFGVGVAAFPERHPRSACWDDEIRHFVAKWRAGADFAITQMFFRAEDYFRLRDRLAAAGCDMPVIPEIIPATHADQIHRFARLSGATFPAELARRLEAARRDPAQSHHVGVEHAVRLAQRLLDGGAPGLHYITLNRSTAVLEIHRSLRLPTGPG